MSICPRCGTTLECAMADNKQEPCWCTQLPQLQLDTVASGKEGIGARSCFCPDCLRALLVEQGVMPKQ